MSSTKTLSLVNECKQSGQDYEFYPTTDEILECLVNHFTAQETRWKECLKSVLDIGAGDGRVLDYLMEHFWQKDDKGNTYKLQAFFAMEKSEPLLKVLSKKDFSLLGTDLLEANLIDKRVDLLFCNPPYSQYELFASKILTEANARYIALVIPQRWANSAELKGAIESRGLSSKILGSFDFLEADRVARAKVDLILFENKQDDEEQFSQWLKTYFKLENILDKNEYESNWEQEQKKEKELEQKTYDIAHYDLVNALVNEYNAEMNLYAQNLKALSSLDGDLLKSLDVNKDGLLKAIRLKLEGTKNLYWKQIFNRVKSIRDRFTSNYRDILYEMVARRNIDFTQGNVRMILVWLIENADDYIKSGMRLFFDSLSEGNARLYKSNERWRNDGWRYAGSKFNNEARKLDYRIVVSGWHLDWHKFLWDIRAVALQLGFNIPNFNFMPRIDKPYSPDCDTFGFYGSTQHIYYKGNKTEILAEIKAYKNGNIHIKFNKEFFAKFNIAVGKMRGWIKNKSEAKAEFKGVSDELIDSVFNASEGLALAGSPLALLEVLH